MKGKSVDTKKLAKKLNDKKEHSVFAIRELIDALYGMSAHHRQGRDQDSVIILSDKPKAYASKILIDLKRRQRLTADGAVKTAQKFIIRIPLSSKQD